MPVSVMESSTLPPEICNGNQIGTDSAPTAAQMVETRSSYMANMVLPEIVKSSKNFPLGPDCLITYSDNPDQSILVNMDLYWFISLEKGCVECKVNICNTGVTKTATTTDPKVIVTRKPRRFEAYSCFICRANFVTVVQALLHMKAFHRQNKKILIQDQNVFHDIDKAMEVPPVPLPWYVAKKQQSIQNIISSVGQMANVSSEGEHASAANATPLTAAQSSNEDETNPVTNLLQAIVKEYGKQVQHVLFGKDFSEVKVEFEDKTSVLAHLPDLVSQDNEENADDINMNEKLEYQVYRMTAEHDDEESCVVRVNNPPLAQKLIISALKQGVSQGATPGDDSPSALPQDSPMPEPSVSPALAEVSQMEHDAKAEESLKVHPSMKLGSRGRPTKTVRFMVGSPDSDDDGNSSTSERLDKEDIPKPIITITEPDDKKQKEDEGLKGVVSQLISTASKGLITPVDPGSPVSDSTAAKVRDDLLTTAALNARFLPKNSSVPNFTHVAGVGIASAASTPLTTPHSQSAGMIRVQSWGGSTGDSQQFRLSTYAPNTPQNFENMTREELRRSFLTVGRAFTYAEKIKLMKKLNDEDSMITQEHVRDAGKLAVATITPTTSKAERKKARRTPSISSVISEVDSVKAATSSAMTTQASGQENRARKASESEDYGVEAIKKSVWTGERKKRRSKYDVDHLIGAAPTQEKAPVRHLDRRKKKRQQSSSEGSVSDHDADDSNSDAFEDKETPPSLLDVMRTAYPTVVTSRSGSLFAGRRPMSASYPSMLTSEYYGSGEWANSAMQTMQKVRTNVGAGQSSSFLPPKLSQDLKMEQTDDDDGDSGSCTPPFVSVNQTESNLFDEISTASVQAHGDFPSAIKANSESMVLALAEQIKNERADSNILNPHVRRKRALSPLKESSRARAKGTAEHLRKKSKQTDMKSSDGPLKTRPRSSDCVPKLGLVVARKGDTLEFTEDFMTLGLDKQPKLSLKFNKASQDKSSSSSDAGGSMDMPQLFENSVETLVRVKFVEKVSVCRVCGYSVGAASNDNVSAIKAHVMEHSLKELLQTGCNGKQLM